MKILSEMIMPNGIYFSLYEEALDKTSNYFSYNSLFLQSMCIYVHVSIIMLT